MADAAETYPEIRCQACGVLLLKGYMLGEIKCRSCGCLQTFDVSDYNIKDAVKLRRLRPGI